MFPTRILIAGICATVVLLVYAVCLYSSWPDLWFSPDSWSYYELARSLSSDKPYAFWTSRSYWSHEYSASFPLGYPSLLWVLHRIFGEHPGVGVALNCVIAALTPWAAGSLAKAAFGKAGYGIYPAIALLLYRDYIYEVIIAGSIPLAILLSLIGLGRLLSAKKPLDCLWVGLLLGSAILVRFDSLIFSMLAGCYLAFRNRRVTHVVSCMAGGLIAVSPWIIYSMTHFGTPWASDNSWVALASTKAYVLDYPALAKDTLLTHPSEWISKVLKNLISMTKAFMAALYRFTYVGFLLACMGLLGVGRFAAGLRKPFHPVLVLPVIAFLALLPQLMTGYFDSRYFSTALLFLAITATCAVFTDPTISQYPKARPVILGLAMAASTAMAANYARQLWSARPERLMQAALDDRILNKLSQSHRSEPNSVYVFPPGNSVKIAKYGAVFKRKSGFLPSNWSTLDEETRQAFKVEFAPMKFLDKAQLEAPDQVDSSPPSSKNE